ncbi:zinc finger, CCHC-type containing protein [Tanacetum coccineum]
MGDKNPIRTLGDYPRPSYKGYRNIIELLEGNNVVPLRSDTIRTAKLHNDILMFQQHQEESLSEAWTRFKDLLQKVPHHGIDLWLQVQIFYDHVNPATRRTIDQSAGGKLRDKNAIESWALLEDLTLYDNEKQNRNLSSLKRVHFVNSIIILNKEDEFKEEESVKSSATKCKDHEKTVESEEEFEEENEEEPKEKEEDNLEHFDAFPTMKELGYHEWLLKNPWSPWVKAKIRIVLVPSCFVIFDLEPLSLSFDFVFTSEIIKSFPCLS